MIRERVTRGGSDEVSFKTLKALSCERDRCYGQGLDVAFQKTSLIANLGARNSGIWALLHRRKLLTILRRKPNSMISGASREDVICPVLSQPRGLNWTSSWRSAFLTQASMCCICRKPRLPPPNSQNHLVARGFSQACRRALADPSPNLTSKLVVIAICGPETKR